VSKVIWKYPLEVTGYQEVSVPRDAEFLHVGSQNGQVCAWALVDPSKGVETVPIHIVGTGNPMLPEGDWRYHLGTVQHGEFVWHIFIGWEQ
jgi:hypothetical protein